MFVNSTMIKPVPLCALLGGLGGSVNAKPSEQQRAALLQRPAGKREPIRWYRIAALVRLFSGQREQVWGWNNKLRFALFG